MNMSRKYTNKILERLDEGLLHRDLLIQNLLMWMSEAEVKEFYESVIGADRWYLPGEEFLDDPAEPDSL